VVLWREPRPKLEDILGTLAGGTLSAYHTPGTTFELTLLFAANGHRYADWRHSNCHLYSDFGLSGNGHPDAVCCNPDNDVGGPDRHCHKQRIRRDHDDYDAGIDRRCDCDCYKWGIRYKHK